MRAPKNYDRFKMLILSSLNRGFVGVPVRGLGIAIVLLVKCQLKTTFGAVVLSLLASAASVHAIATLRISADLGATWVTARDIDGDGSVNFSGSVGTVGNMWSVSVAAGETKPAVGSAADPVMNVSGVNIQSSQAGTLLVEFSDKSFSAPLIGNAFTTSLNSQNQGAGNTTVRSYWDSVNTMFARTTRLGTVTQTGVGSSSVVSDGVALPTSGLYSLTVRLTIFHDAGGVSSFGSSLVDPNVVTQVPDGGSTVILLGFAFVALAAFRRWFRLGRPTI